MTQKQKLRMALLHVHIVQGNMYHNHKILSEAMAIAAGYGCQLVLTGELVECGPYFWRNIRLKTIPSKTYPYLESLKEVAYKYRMHIILGRAEKDAESGTLLSTYTHISKLGNINAHYRKQMIESEEEHQYVALGRQLVSTEIEHLKIGLMIGYNQRIEELMMYYKRQDIDLICCAVTPIYHEALSREVENLERFIQPIIFCNYDLEMTEVQYTSESVCLGNGRGMVFRPECSAVIVLDFDRINKSFEMVKCINVHQLLY